MRRRTRTPQPRLELERYRLAPTLVAEAPSRDCGEILSCTPSGARTNLLQADQTTIAFTARTGCACPDLKKTNSMLS